jgi:hypothetical protein
LATSLPLRKVQDPACYELAEHFEAHYRKLCDELAGLIQETVASFFYRKGKQTMSSRNYPGGSQSKPAPPPASQPQPRPYPSGSPKGEKQ